MTKSKNQKPSLQERIDRLPPDLRQSVETLVDALLEKGSRRPRGPHFSWAGALRENDNSAAEDVQRELLEEPTQDD